MPDELAAAKPLTMKSQMLSELPISLDGFMPGKRIAVAVSGGADSVALLRAMHSAAPKLGLVMRVAHVNHGLRGQESDGDADFVRALAEAWQLPLDVETVNTAGHVEDTGESVEQAARTLRYGFFHRLLQSSAVDIVATAHTLDDQAETVLLKWMRGAWTEGLGGISPVVEAPPGKIVRPLLQTTRAQVEEYLNALQQPWRNDSSNASLDFTRNRVRNGLLPALRTFNPNIAQQLSRMAEIARDEEAHWQAELPRILPGLLLPGKPVRGGGRSVAAAAQGRSLSLDVVRLTTFSVAVQRRVLRAAALQLGHRLEFDAVARLLDMLEEKPGSRTQIAHTLQAERTARELRLTECFSKPERVSLADVECLVPGITTAPEFGVRVEVTHSEGAEVLAPAVLRVWRAGDRVRLRHTLSEQKVKDVLQRLRATPEQKAVWPVLEWQGKIVWMRGCEVMETPGGPFFHVVSSE